MNPASLKFYFILFIIAIRMLYQVQKCIDEP